MCLAQRAIKHANALAPDGTNHLPDQQHHHTSQRLKIVRDTIEASYFGRSTDQLRLISDSHLYQLQQRFDHIEEHGVSQSMQ